MKITQLRDAQIDTRPNYKGCLDVWVNLFFVENEIIVPEKSAEHCVRIEPDSDLAERFSALNDCIVNYVVTDKNTGEKYTGWEALSADDWAKVEAVCEELHTPEVKAAYAAWKAEQEALAGQE